MLACAVPTCGNSLSWTLGMGREMLGGSETTVTPREAASRSLGWQKNAAVYQPRLEVTENILLEPK